MANGKARYIMTGERTMKAKLDVWISRGVVTLLTLYDIGGIDVDNSALYFAHLRFLLQGF